ncbi:MAG: hypothetical protein KAR38_00955, partial [Calditrichia bacterium]|nr:hypothetical protein [Calditrichia bacterium]
MQEFNRQELEQKLNLSPQSTVFAHLAYLHIQEGEVERGLEICQSHIVNHKKYGFGHFILGLCLHKTGNNEEALNELEVATFLDPNIYEAWKLLKKLYEDRGDEEKTATANNFTGIWEKTEAVTAMAGEEFTVDDFIEDTDLGDTQEESLETIDVNESDDETLEAVDFGKAEESLDDFDLGDLETSDAIETTEELLGVQEKK